MGCAKYVGRVGALAVALGIGAALVGTGPGIAWAQDEGGDPGSQSQDSPPPGETPGDPTPETPGNDSSGGGHGDGTPSTPDVDVEPNETGITGLTTTTGGHAPTVTISSSGGALSSHLLTRLLGLTTSAEDKIRVAPRVVQPVAAGQWEGDQRGVERGDEAGRQNPRVHQTVAFGPSSDGAVAGNYLNRNNPGLPAHEHAPAENLPVGDVHNANALDAMMLAALAVDPPHQHEPPPLLAQILYMMMPNVFLDDAGQPNALSNYLFPPNHHEPGHEEGGNGDGHGSHGDGGGAMAMECMAGMTMPGMDMGCDSMDHSMTPMMLVTAQGQVKPAATPGHDMGSMPAEAMPAGHDMGSMPAEAMPAGHDMSNMPAETMPPGHDMSNMPGGMPGMPMPPGSTMPNMPGMPAGGHTAVKGLLPSQDGYTFRPENTDIGDGNFAFTIAGPDGAPVKDYTTLHDRDLHLIVASDDLRQYAHLHPMLDDNGRWFVKTPSDFSPGKYRAFADFDPEGTQTQLTLGIDLTKPGAAPAAKPLVPSNKDSVDGFDVSLDFTGTEATVTVRRNGEVVTTQPYLAAAGHLVTLREGDLAYLHVHPMDTEPDGPVNFMVSLPSAGTYAMFFDFKVDNVVRTARFVVDQP